MAFKDDSPNIPNSLLGAQSVDSRKKDMANQISGNKILPAEITDDLIVKLGLENYNNNSQSQSSFDLHESEEA